MSLQPGTALGPYEILEGESQASLIAAILEHESVQMASLQTMTPRERGFLS